MQVAVIEDEARLAASLKEGLEQEGFPTDTYPDAESFERRSGENPYRLLIMDLMLPKKDGFALATSLRTAGMTTPILVLTARDTVEDKVRALDSGADDYLAKPFSFDELFARMRALTRRGEPVGTMQASRGVVLDFGAREVTRDGARIILTTKEFELLALLMEHSGKAISRDVIFDRLWKGEDLRESNVVDVHVSKLRKKIDDDHDIKLIETVRGVGYAFAR